LIIEQQSTKASEPFFFGIIISSHIGKKTMRTSVEESSDEQAAFFFQELKRELHLESTQSVVSLMRGVCAKVPWNYSEEGRGRVIAGTPPLFHLLIGDRQIQRGNRIQHLDELADAMYQECKHRKIRLFKTEIDALRGVIIVLAGIQKFFDRIKLQPFGYTLRRELQRAMEGN
jgi:hypothetical protein